jgi:hypothetical protein
MSKVLLKKIETLDRASSDYAFISNAWLRSYRHSAFAGKIPSDVYFYKHEPLIARVIEASEIIIACNPDDQDQLFGFLCYENKKSWYYAHYIYVKKVFRGMDIATDMLKMSGLDSSLKHLATHRTTDYEVLARKLNSPFIYNPYTLLEDYNGT